MAYCLCCIYFIIFVFFAHHQSQDTVLPLGCFFFSKTPLPAKIHDDAFDVLPSPLIKTLRFGAKTQFHQSEPSIQTAQSELAQKTPLLLITNTAYNAFFLLYLVTQEEEIFGRVNEGVRVSLAFFCLICVVLPIPNKC